jgi:hypothetical protein
MTALQNIVTYGPYCFLGFLISQLCDLASSGIKPSDFSARKWIDDNLYQALLSIFILAALVILGDPLVKTITSESLTISTCFWAGVGSDGITNAFARRKRNIDSQIEQKI